MENIGYILILIGLINIILKYKENILLLLNLELIFIGISLYFINISLIYDDIGSFIYGLIILIISALETSIGITILLTIKSTI